MNYNMSENTVYRFYADTPEEAEGVFQAFYQEGTEVKDGVTYVYGTEVQVKIVDYDVEKGW